MRADGFPDACLDEGSWRMHLIRAKLSRRRMQGNMGSMGPALCFQTE